MEKTQVLETDEPLIDIPELRDRAINPPERYKYTKRFEPETFPGPMYLQTGKNRLESVYPLIDEILGTPDAEFRTTKEVGHIQSTKLVGILESYFETDNYDAFRYLFEKTCYLGFRDIWHYIQNLDIPFAPRITNYILSRNIYRDLDLYISGKSITFPKERLAMFWDTFLQKFSDADENLQRGLLSDFVELYIASVRKKGYGGITGNVFDDAHPPSWNIFPYNIYTLPLFLSEEYRVQGEEELEVTLKNVLEMDSCAGFIYAVHRFIENDELNILGDGRLHSKIFHLIRYPESSVDCLEKYFQNVKNREKPEIFEALQKLFIKIDLEKVREVLVTIREALISLFINFIPENPKDLKNRFRIRYISENKFPNRIEFLTRVKSTFKSRVTNEYANQIFDLIDAIFPNYGDGNLIDYVILSFFSNISDSDYLWLLRMLPEDILKTSYETLYNNRLSIALDFFRSELDIPIPRYHATLKSLLKKSCTQNQFTVVLKDVGLEGLWESLKILELGEEYLIIPDDDHALYSWIYPSEIIYFIYQNVNEKRKRIIERTIMNRRDLREPEIFMLVKTGFVPELDSVERMVQQKITSPLCYLYQKRAFPEIEKILIELGVNVKAFEDIKLRSSEPPGFLEHKLRYQEYLKTKPWNEWFSEYITTDLSS